MVLKKRSRRTFSRKRSNSIAVKVKRLSKKISGLHIESKAISSATQAQGIIGTTNLSTSNPMSYLLNGLSQGTGDEGRIGDKVHFKYLDLRGRILADTDLLSHAMIRIILVRELQPSAAPASLLSIYGQANPQVWNVRDITTRNPNRFRILYDRTFMIGPYINSMNGAGTSPMHNQSHPEMAYFSIKRKMDFTSDYSRSNLGTIADFDGNSLYLFALSDSGTANAVTVQWHYNLTYTDL